MRRALIASVAVLFVLGVNLILAPGDTARYFSWPIEPALTASVMAANYATAIVILVLAMRGWVWAPVRVVLPGGIAFSALVTLATFLHLDKFSFGSEEAFAGVIAWVWLVAYLILPPLLVAFWPAQIRAPGEDPAPVPPARWLTSAVLAIGAVFLATGLGLYLVPDRVAEVWPWGLTPLTGRVLGAWALGLGLVFALGGRSRDRMRMRAPVVGLVVFAALQGLALARNGSDADGVALGVWVTALAAIGAVGAAGIGQVWSADPARGGVIDS
jgi:hypothetical protein